MINQISRNEAIGVVVTLVATFGLLFFGNYFFKNGDNPSKDAQKKAVESQVIAPTAKGALKLDDTLVGEGELVKSGDTVSIHYVGTLSSGTKFDSSYDRGEPITFKTGSGQLISGFDQGVIGMKAGGKRKITIPPELGYGSRETGPIPPNSTLIFDVELVKITP
ncbi:MAG: FKBP-type peptidyl-prolyl cis-trans isomerase [Candidatus Taylorbacteria bacterium]|nr:FKBP-type peptidyl-prolyl cis-trans isomerase [Candidatus Taylorbacteria bacterium]